jgi:hypothetical protein
LKFCKKCIIQKFFNKRHKTKQNFSEMIKQSTALHQHQAAQATTKGAAFSKRIMRLGDMREKQEVIRLSWFKSFPDRYMLISIS